jgi:glyoxalase family protein
VRPDHAICGFHSATLSEEGYEETARLVGGLMGFTQVGAEGNRFRYAAPGGGPGSLVDLLCAPDGQAAWRADFAQAGLNPTPVIDRTYFHSVYFREPGGVLFELATDPPGFTVDEPGERLGERLMLPEWLERHRADIERVLPRLTRSTDAGR